MLINGSRINTALRCQHCLQPLSSAGKNESGFCCIGCQAAYKLIHGFNLDYFYRLKEDSIIDLESRPKVIAQEAFEHFNSQEFRDKFIVCVSREIGRIDFKVPAIHCSACVWLLEKLPEVMVGIERVRVDLTRSKLSVWFSAQSVKLSEIAQMLCKLGYEPHPIALDPSARASNKSDVLFALQLGVAAFSAMNVMLLFVARYQGLFTGIEPHYEKLFAWASFALTTPSVVFSALPFYRTSLAGLRLGRLHIDLPISIAIVGGFAASAVNTILGRAEIYFDTVSALIFLLLVGRWCQRRGMKQVASASELLYSIAPTSAIRLQSDGGTKLTEQTVFVEALRVGDRIILNAGQRIPCDGTLLSDYGVVNNALLSGESTPAKVLAGETVYCGAVNAGGRLEISVQAVGDQTRLGRLIQEIEGATLRDSAIGQFTDRIAKYFVSAVLVLAAITLAVYLQDQGWEALDRVFALLIVSCPCALGIATPIVLSLASSRAAQAGLLLKNGTALERLARVNKIYFDKTGTLTLGELSVASVEYLSKEIKPKEIWQMVEALERHAQHPAAQALKNHAIDFTSPTDHVIDCTEIPGRGVEGRTANGEVWRIGALSWLESQAVRISTDQLNKIPARLAAKSSIVALAKQDSAVALFALSDTLRPEAPKLIAALAKRGIASAILSGDSEMLVKSVAAELGMPSQEAYGGVSPENKAAIIKSKGETTALVGDGINDALALSAAGVGIGIKGGAEICMQVSDVFLLKPNLLLLIELVDGARAAVAQIHRHLAVSLVYNLSAAMLAVFGLIGPLAAALIMPASSLSVILSSLWKAPFKRSSVWR